MKANIQRGALILIASLMLSTTYLNCSGNSMSPVDSSNTDNLSTLNNNTDNGVCANSATNSPLCTTNFFGNCINGSANPPECSSDTTACLNGAANSPSCTMAGDGSCITGALNPPNCTTYAECENGAIDYPACTQLNGGGFDVILSKSGSLSKYSIEIKMDFNAGDINQQGAIFLVAQKKKPGTQDMQTYVCVKPCNKDTDWKDWTADPNVDWSISGLKMQVGVSGGTQGLQSIYSRVGDITHLGGAKVYAGYGLGNTVYNAINEMLSYRSPSIPDGRFLEVLTVPTQSMAFSLSGPTGGSPGAISNYDLWGGITPSSEDYGKAGYFFVLVQNPAKTINKLYKYSSGGPVWVDWDGNANSLGDKFYKSDSAIKNEFFSVYKGSAVDYAGWSIYIGYGTGSNPTEAGLDCINSKKYNHAYPFIVQ